jgi:hypothetical protein
MITSKKKRKTNNVTSTPWYRKFERFVQLNGLGTRSQDVYLNWVRQLDRRFPGKSTPHLSSDQVLDFLLDLQVGRKLAPSTVNQAVCGLRNFYRDHLGKDWDIWKKIKIRREEPLPHVLTRTYHSCNHRSCPQCGAHAQQLWTARQEARLLPVPYFMITFTVPCELRALCKAHPGELCNILIKESAAALKDVIGTKIGGTAGFTSVFHSWTRQKHRRIGGVLDAAKRSPKGEPRMGPG